MIDQTTLELVRQLQKHIPSLEGPYLSVLAGHVVPHIAVSEHTILAVNSTSIVCVSSLDREGGRIVAAYLTRNGNASWYAVLRKTHSGTYELIRLENDELLTVDEKEIYNLPN